MVFTGYIPCTAVFYFDKEKFEEIADAIREKTGESGLIKPSILFTLHTIPLYFALPS